MTRWIAALGCALAIALTVPVGNQANADGFERRVVAPVFTRKRCIAPARRWFFRMSATPVTWVCAATEKCCYDRLLRKGTCIAASARCF